MSRRSLFGEENFKNSVRIASLKDKLAWLRDRICRSVLHFGERRQARPAWWQCVFRTPPIGFSWLFQKATSFQTGATLNVNSWTNSAIVLTGTQTLKGIGTMTISAVTFDVTLEACFEPVQTCTGSFAQPLYA